MDEDEDFENELFLHFSKTFRATRIIGNVLYPTKFKMSTDIWLDFDGLNSEEQDYHLNLAISKFNFFVDQILDMSIVFCSTNDWAVNSFLNLGLPAVDNQIVLAPKEPSDDHLAMLMQCKISSLGKGYVFSSGLKLTSDTSRGLAFTFVGDALHVLPDMKEWVGERSFFKTPWWGRDDASTLDITPATDDNLEDLPSFAYSLDFLGEMFKEQSEVSQPKVIRPTFKPKIIRNEDTTPENKTDD